MARSYRTRDFRYHFPMTARRRTPALRIAIFTALAVAAWVLNWLRFAHATEIRSWLVDHASGLAIVYLLVEAAPAAMFLYCCWRIWRVIREPGGRAAPSGHPQG